MNVQCDRCGTYQEVRDEHLSLPAQCQRGGHVFIPQAQAPEGSEDETIILQADDSDIFALSDSFERDERIQQMSLTITDLEAALTDRVAEIRELESQNAVAMQEVTSVRRGERTREVVGRVFADSLSLVRGHDAREAKREAYANSPDVERTLSTPDADDMRNLAEGGTVDLDVEESELPQGIDVDDVRPPSPGGSGDPVLFEDESENADE